MADRRITIDQFLTEEEIKLARKLYIDNALGFHNRCMEEIILPNMERINAALGQENDPRYLAYAVEYVMSVERGL